MTAVTDFDTMISAAEPLAMTKKQLFDEEILMQQSKDNKVFSLFILYKFHLPLCYFSLFFC